MHIKYSPVNYNPNANTAGKPNTEIKVIDENTLSIDGELFEFNTNSVQWEELREQTSGYILDAYRDSTGELYVTVRRYYTGSTQPEWDTGDYHEVRP